MLVSLPLLLIVLDFWPLRRGLRIAEKLPFAALALASSIVTLAAQENVIWGSFDATDRVANALVTLTGQLGRAVWPVDLAVLYPYPVSGQIETIITSGSVMAALVALAVVLRRRAPYLGAGLLWFVIGLAPTLGLVQVGVQSTADRYTYLPQIGLWIALVWAVPATRVALTLATAAWAIALVAFAATTRAQLAWWTDDLALWLRTVAVTEGNWFAHTEAGVELAARGRNDEAVIELAEAVRLAPKWERAQSNYGFVLLRVHRAPEAVEHLKIALALDPTTGGPGERHLYLARALEETGQKSEAIAEYERHLALLPDDARATRALERLRATAAP